MIFLQISFKELVNLIHISDNNDLNLISDFLNNWHMLYINTNFQYIKNIITTSTYHQFLTNCKLPIQFYIEHIPSCVTSKILISQLIPCVHINQSHSVNINLLISSSPSEIILNNHPKCISLFKALSHISSSGNIYNVPAYIDIPKDILVLIENANNIPLFLLEIHQKALSEVNIFSTTISSVNNKINTLISSPNPEEKLLFNEKLLNKSIPLFP